MANIGRNAQTIVKQIIRARPSWFWAGFLIGFLYFGYTFLWIWSLYPLSSVGIENGILGGGIVAFIFLYSVAAMATWWGIGCLVAYRITRDVSTKLRPACLASVFVLVEYARSWFWGIAWLGPETSWGPHWTFGNLAYLVANSDLLSATASWIGMYGIEFLLVFLGYTLWLAARSTHSRNTLIIQVVFTFVFMAAGYAFNHVSSENERGIPVAVVQTKMPTSVDGDTDLHYFREELRLIESATSDMPTGGVIVLPEGAGFMDNLRKFLSIASFEKYFRNLSSENITIIDNIKYPTDTHPTSRIVALESHKGMSGFYDKQVLTPNGEFIPYIMRWPLIFLNKTLTARFDLARGITKGTNDNLVPTAHGMATLIVCSDIFSPGLSDNPRSEFLVAMSSIGIFRGNTQLDGQLRAAAQVRARENRKYLVFASNYGTSFVTDANGYLVSVSSSQDSGILTGAVVPRRTATWYTRVGDWPILVSALAVLAVARKRYRHEQ